MTQAERDRLVTLKKAKKKVITLREAAEEPGLRRSAPARTFICRRPTGLRKCELKDFLFSVRWNIQAAMHTFKVDLLKRSKMIRHTFRQMIRISATFATTLLTVAVQARDFSADLVTTTGGKVSTGKLYHTASLERTPFQRLTLAAGAVLSSEMSRARDAPARFGVGKILLHGEWDDLRGRSAGVVWVVGAGRG
jgi:hypothetical protein